MVPSFCFSQIRGWFVAAVTLLVVLNCERGRAAVFAAAATPLYDEDHQTSMEFETRICRCEMPNEGLYYDYDDNGRMLRRSRSRQEARYSARRHSATTSRIRGRDASTNGNGYVIQGSVTVIPRDEYPCKHYYSDEYHYGKRALHEVEQEVFHSNGVATAEATFELKFTPNWQVMEEGPDEEDLRWDLVDNMSHDEADPKNYNTETLSGRQFLVSRRKLGGSVSKKQGRSKIGYASASFRKSDTVSKTQTTRGSSSTIVTDYRATVGVPRGRVVVSRSKKKHSKQRRGRLMSGRTRYMDTTASSKKDRPLPAARARPTPARTRYYNQHSNKKNSVAASRATMRRRRRRRNRFRMQMGVGRGPRVENRSKRANPARAHYRRRRRYENRRRRRRGKGRSKKSKKAASTPKYFQCPKLRPSRPPRPTTATAPPSPAPVPTSPPTTPAPTRSPQPTPTRTATPSREPQQTPVPTPPTPTLAPGGDPAWSLDSTLDDSEDGEQLGVDFDMSGDASLLAAGGPGFDGGNGRVVVYDLTVSDNPQLLATLRPRASESLGFVVTMSDNGSRLATNDFSDVNIYTINRGTGSVVLDFAFPLGLGEYAKFAMSDDGNWLAVTGEQEVFPPTSPNEPLYNQVLEVYARDQGEWTSEFFTTVDTFDLTSDYSIAVSGNRLAVGRAGKDDQIGSVRVYERVLASLATWTQIGQVLQSGQVGDAFGATVDMANNGSFLAIGAPYAEQVQVWRFTQQDNHFFEFGSPLTPPTEMLGTEATDFGHSFAFSVNGGRLVIGAPCAFGNEDTCPGAFVSFEYLRSAADWVPFGDIVQGTQGNGVLGQQVRMSQNGTKISVSAPDYCPAGEAFACRAGAVFLYEEGSRRTSAPTVLPSTGPPSPTTGPTIPTSSPPTSLGPTSPPALFTTSPTSPPVFIVPTTPPTPSPSPQGPTMGPTPAPQPSSVPTLTEPTPIPSSTTVPPTPFPLCRAKIVTHSYDTRFLSVNDAIGDMEYFGDKDNQGRAVRWTSFLSLISQTSIAFDDIGRPETFAGTDGTRIEFQYITDSDIAVKYFHPGMDNVILRRIDLEASFVEPVPLRTRELITTKGKDHDDFQEQVISATTAGVDVEPSQSAYPIEERQLQFPYCNAQVEIQRCEEAVDDAGVQFYAELLSTNGVLSRNYYNGSLIGTAMYGAVFPQFTIPVPDPVVACPSTQDLMQNVCFGLNSETSVNYATVLNDVGNLELFCERLTSSNDNIGPESCVNLLSSFSRACEPAVVAEECFSLNCDTYVDDRSPPLQEPEAVYIEALTISPTYRSLSSMTEVVNGVCLVDLPPVDIGNFFFELTDVVVIPVDPEPQDRYLFAAGFWCLDPSSDSVEVTIVRTDGYTDTETCVPETFGSMVCFLRLPGADALVRDVVSIAVQTAFGKVDILVEIIFDPGAAGPPTIAPVSNGPSMATPEPTIAPIFIAPTSMPTPGLEPPTTPTPVPTFGGTTWYQVNGIFDSVDGEGFGWSVDLIEDLSVVTAGAPFAGVNNTGRVRYFDFANDLLEIIDGLNPDDFFGVRVAVSQDGGLLVASSVTSQIEVFASDSVVPIDTTVTAASSGPAMALSPDGAWLAVTGEDMASETEYVQLLLVYQSTDGGVSWDLWGDVVPVQIFTVSGDYVVAMSGNRVAVGRVADTDRLGLVRVYERTNDGGSNGEWIQVGNDLFPFVGIQGGMSLSLANNGTILAIGLPYVNLDQGQVNVYVYESTTDVWATYGSNITAPDLGASNFGTSVSLSALGHRIAVGAPCFGDSCDGATRVFQFDGEDWLIYGETHQGFHASAFGQSVRMTPSGTSYAAGAPLDCNSTEGTSCGGSVYIFSENPNATGFA